MKIHSAVLEPTPAELRQRYDVLAAIISSVKTDVVIKLPAVGELNRFGGILGPYCYQFEGEDDLLHLSVVRNDGAELSAEEGQAVAGFLMPGLPPGLIWIRPGEFSQHFYCGHDDLVVHVAP